MYVLTLVLLVPSHSVNEWIWQWNGTVNILFSGLHSNCITHLKGILLLPFTWIPSSHHRKFSVCQYTHKIPFTTYKKIHSRMKTHCRHVIQFFSIVAHFCCCCCIVSFVRAFFGLCGTISYCINTRPKKKRLNLLVPDQIHLMLATISTLQI